MGGVLKQDPEAKIVFIIWYDRDPYYYEQSPQWEYMVYFDRKDYELDLEWIKDKYKNIKVRIYKISKWFDIKEPELV